METQVADCRSQAADYAGSSVYKCFPAFNRTSLYVMYLMMTLRKNGFLSKGKQMGEKRTEQRKTQKVERFRKRPGWTDIGLQRFQD